MTKLSLSVIIPTFNEQKNIGRCLASVYGWVEAIFIVDSYSTDQTIEIVKKFACNIYHHPFENYAKQFNWALEHIPIKTEWILRLDADERVTLELRKELLEKLPTLNRDITGIYLKRRVLFMGRWIKHGGYYPVWLLRIWRKRKAYCEERWMDEHMKITEGAVLFLKNDIIDENQKDLHWWIGKHNSYATREAIDILNLKYNFLSYNTVSAKLSGTQEQRTRWLKEEIYAKIPLFLRPFLYFIYRYFFRLGFLDGKEGLVWHFLQGFWYRFLVDAKIYEMKKKAKKEQKGIKEIIEEIYDINL